MPGSGAGKNEIRGPFVAANPERLDPFRTQALKWPVHALYTPLDLDAVGFDYEQDLGFPGEYPYTRGTSPNGHRSQLWTMTQVTGFGSGADWAKRARYMLDQGLQGLILEHDLPTTNGYDSDDPLVAGEVGRAGLAIDSLEDLEAGLRSAVRQAQIPDVVCNAPQPVNLAMIIAALEKKGVDPAQFTLHIVERHPDRVHLRRPLHLPAEARPPHRDRLIEYIIRHHPNWVPISIISAQLHAGKGQSGPRAGLLAGDRAGTTSTRCWSADSTSIPSRRTSISSSTSTWISSKASASCAPIGSCGRG